MTEENVEILKEKVNEEKKTIADFINLNKQLQSAKSEKSKESISSEIKFTKEKLKKQKDDSNEILTKISLFKPLDLSMLEDLKAIEIKKGLDEASLGYPFLSKQETPSMPITKKDLSFLEKVSLKRLRKKDALVKLEKEDKPSRYVNLAVRNFYSMSRKLIYGGMFGSLKRTLVKANMQFIPENYVSVIFFTTLLSIFVSIFLFIFLLFFNISLELPIITAAGESFQERILKFILIPLIVPLVTFFTIYFYPSAERRSIESKINQELPFVTIHMSSISGAMKDPSKMFGIIILTGEYPNIKKEFSKIINEINLYGYDLVSALRNSSFNCPSEKLAELYNGISATISSGGNLSQFFEKRAETLLFDYKIERDKYNKATETFMDIYLSVVIAGPMILMLLLIIMRVSGLGIALSTSMISLIAILGVTIANIFFLLFLYLKQPAQ